VNDVAGIPALSYLEADVEGLAIDDLLKHLLGVGGER